MHKITIARYRCIIGAARSQFLGARLPMHMDGANAAPRTTEDALNFCLPGCLLVSYWPLVLREHRITRGFIYECRESAPKYKYDGAEGYVHGRVLRGRVVDARRV